MTTHDELAGGAEVVPDYGMGARCVRVDGVDYVREDIADSMAGALREVVETWSEGEIAAEDSTTTFGEKTLGEVVRRALTTYERMHTHPPEEWKSA